jgi:hypothetical protein
MAADESSEQIPTHHAGPSVAPCAREVTDMIARHNGSLVTELWRRQWRSSFWAPLAVAALSTSACSDAQQSPPHGVVTSALSTWANQAFSLSRFTATFDAVPTQNLEDVTIGLSQGPAAGYTDLAAIVRFNSSGAIDVRNGSAYAALAHVPYTAGESYHVQMTVDVPSHSYTVHVTPPGGAAILLAQNYAFRTEQASVTSLGYLSKGAASGDATVSNTEIAMSPSNLQGSSAPPTPTPIPTPAPTPSPATNGAPVPDVTSFTGIDAPGAAIDVDGARYWVENVSQPYSLENPDSQTLRFELHAGQCIENGSQNDCTNDGAAERSEVDGAAGPLIPNASTIHITYQFMMEPGQANSARWMVIGQVDSTAGSPPISVQMNGEHMAVSIGWISSMGGSLPTYWTTTSSELNGTPISYAYAYQDSNPIQRGHYYNMDITINQAKGTLVVLRDDVPIVNYNGPLGFGESTHWAYGIYRGNTTNDIQSADYRNMVLTTAP